MDPFTLMAVGTAAGSVLGGMNSASASKKAAQTQANAITAGKAQYDQLAGQARGDLNASTDKAIGYVAPYASAGDGALQQYLDAIGVNGADAQKRFHSGFMDDPGFQAALDQGQRQVEHSALVGGYGNSGSHMKELFQFGENQRLGAFNSRLDRLSQLSNLGLTASGQAGGFESGRGSGLAQIALGQGKNAMDAAMGIGAANAKGITGEASAWNGALSGLGSAAMIYGAGQKGSGGGGNLGGLPDPISSGKTITNLFG